MNDYLTLPHVGCLSYISLTFALGLLTSWTLSIQEEGQDPFDKIPVYYALKLNLSVHPSILLTSTPAAVAADGSSAAACRRPMSSWHQHWSSPGR